VEVLNALTFRVSLRNNLVVNNVATDVGGGIAVDDSSDLRLVNNTVARNQTTATAQDSDGNPHGAGLAAHPFTPGFQATLSAGSSSFPNPVMFNNIFWENRAFTADAAAESGLTERAVIDLEVVNPLTPSVFTPVWSLLTAPYGPPSGSNLIGQNPQFVNAFETNAQATPGPTAGPGGPLQVSITPPDGPPDVPGNYHLQGTSPAVDRGARCSNTAFPAPANALSACTGGGVAAPSGLNADIDGNFRPMLRTLRIRTPWDLGADELPGLPVPLS
jgi:parallel beta-helix repeat protein